MCSVGVDNEGRAARMVAGSCARKSTQTRSCRSCCGSRSSTLTASRVSPGVWVCVYVSINHTYTHTHKQRESARARERNTHAHTHTHTHTHRHLNATCRRHPACRCSRCSRRRCPRARAQRAQARGGSPPRRPGGCRRPAQGARWAGNPHRGLEVQAVGGDGGHGGVEGARAGFSNVSSLIVQGLRGRRHLQA
jgi:hypothetical protein